VDLQACDVLTRKARARQVLEVPARSRRHGIATQRGHGQIELALQRGIDLEVGRDDEPWRNGEAGGEELVQRRGLTAACLGAERVAAERRQISSPGGRASLD
jgi:hypothetical protein